MASEAAESGQAGPFTVMLSCFLSVINNERFWAEAFFDQFKTADPDAMATELVAVLSHFTDHNYHEMAADLIRRLIASRPRLQPLTESTLQSDLLSSLEREQHSSVRDKIYDAVPEHAAAVGEWPELVPFLLHCVSSKDPRLQQVALGIYPGLPYHIAESALEPVLIECMNTASSKEVRMAAVITAVRFFQISPSASEPDFLRLQPMMLKELKAARRPSGTRSCRWW